MFMFKSKKMLTAMENRGTSAESLFNGSALFFSFINDIHFFRD